ncbi:MAG: hypothetical protein ABIO44_03495 [Saprospiraceae bacterium]
MTHNKLQRSLPINTLHNNCLVTIPIVNAFVIIFARIAKIHAKNDGLNPSLKIFYSSLVFFNVWLNSNNLFNGVDIRDLA